MELHIIQSGLAQSIDKERTTWCCDEFRDCGDKRKIIRDENGNYIGEEPEYIFNWEEEKFQHVTNSIMLGMGGFGDRFWGDNLTECPFCKTTLENMKIIKHIVSNREHYSDMRDRHKKQNKF